MVCECRTNNRFLIIKATEKNGSCSELFDLARLPNWSEMESGVQLMVEVGGASQYSTARDVVNFLRTIVTDGQFQNLTASWLPTPQSNGGSCCSIKQTAMALEPVFVPLDIFAPLDASPLVKTLRSGRIQTYFQPVFRNDGKTVWGHECLMRATADDGSLLMPKQLLDWAKQERLVFMLDRICRETHIRNAALLLPDDVSILINFLPTAIYDPTFCLRTTIAAAKSAGIDPKRVIFEVVETENVRDTNHLATILNEYRKSGFRVALDDVGSGFAGLTLLADLNPDLIKIDRELVQGAGKSEMHRIIVRALVQIARESGGLVLAEGVETQAEMELMQTFGVDLFQGFLLGKPAPCSIDPRNNRNGLTFEEELRTKNGPCTSQTHLLHDTVL